MLTPTAYRHVVATEEGVPIISGTTTKVVEVVRDHLSGDSAAEIHRQYPYLSLAQIHSALAFYYDHQSDLDRDLERRQQAVEDFKARAGASPLQEKLRQATQRP